MEIQSENLEQVKEEIKDLKGRAKAAKRAMRQSKADKAEKSSKFAATLSQLRRERGISQKKPPAIWASARHCCPITKKAFGSAGWTLWSSAPTTTA